jgi:RNA polymerase sigma-70 factor (ECF subfamily)
MKDPSYPPNRDQVLWEGFKNGDKQAFNKIYREYYPKLLVYGLKIKNKKDFIEDCIHEIFCDLLNHANNLGNTDNILFYLYASLRRKIFRRLQYDFSFRASENPYFDTLRFSENSSEEHVIDKENLRIKKRIVKRMIESLSQREKEVLLMRFYLDFEYTDISQIMDINIQSVRNLVYRAIKALREQIKNNFP